MGRFWTNIVVIVHKNARSRTRKSNNTLSVLKSAHLFARQTLLFSWNKSTLIPTKERLYGKEPDL